MFLHSGASLHGHEYNRPSPTTAHLQQQRKRPFLAPILYSASASASASASVSEVQPTPQPFKPRTRPVSEVHYRPISDLFNDDPPISPPAPTHPAPVVRFKSIKEEIESPISPTTAADSSLYDSDASETTASSPRPRRRKTTPRSSTNFLLAVPPPRTSTKKALLKATRPRLLLQLQELPSNQRPRPSVDVFPASLWTGSLSKSCCVNRFSRLCGTKGELGPRDLVLVQSEDYTNGPEEEEDKNGRRQPVAVIRRGRNPDDREEIVLDDGRVWTCTNEKGYHSFVHVDEDGRSLTARWVKRSATKRISSISSARTSSSSNSNPSTMSTGADSPDPDCRFTFSLINPLSRRHPILANLTPQSLEIFDSYTTPSPSQGRYPPTRPMSDIIDDGSSVGSASPRSPLFEESFTKRETHLVDESVKKLITVTSLWLTLRLGPSGPVVPATDCGSDAGTSDYSGPCSQDSVSSVQPGPAPTRTVARRQTLSSAMTGTPPSQPTGLRRAMSTGASFISRRRSKQQPVTAESTYGERELEKVIETETAGVGVGMGTGKGTGSVTTTDPAPAVEAPPTRQNPRLSWFRKRTQ